MPEVRHMQISVNCEGQRLDNFLRRELKGLPKTRLYRLLRRGEIRINGGRVQPAYRLRHGDCLRLPPMRLGEREVGAKPSQHVLQRLEGAILHENERLLVLDKPSGLAVHGGSGLAYGVVEALRAQRPDVTSLDLAHRLDRDTSGCLVIAKRRDTLRQLHGLLRAGRVEKRYLTLLKGELSDGALRVEAPLERWPGKGLLQPVGVSAAGRPALTVFHPIECYPGWTLADVELHTGRMHQIRVHAACRGYPIAGDERYGDRKANRALRRLGLRRLFLHASRIAFELPGQGEVVAQAAFSEELAAVLRCLRQQSSAEGATQ